MGKRDERIDIGKEEGRMDGHGEGRKEGQETVKEISKSGVFKTV